MFKKLLIPLEFGAPTEAILAEARLLGDEDAEFGLLHVLPSEFSLSLTELGQRELVLKEVEDWLSALEAEFEPPGRVRSALAEGKTDAQILREAAEFSADCIVLGSHGRKGLPRFLLGSIAEKVLRASPIPICVVKATTPGAPTSSLERVAIASDLGPSSAAATEVFAGLVDGTGARGLVVHAFSKAAAWSAAPLPAPYLEGAYWGVTLQSEEIEKHLHELRAQRETDLENLSTTLAKSGSVFETVLIDGEPWEEIANLVASKEIDLLVLGTKHPGVLERMTIGSAAEKILRSVDCPVLVVPQLA